MGVCRKLETSDITKRSVTNLGDRLDVLHVMNLVYGQNFTAKSKLKSFSFESFRLDVFVLMVTPDSNTAKSVSVFNSTTHPPSYRNQSSMDQSNLIGTKLSSSSPLNIKCVPNNSAICNVL